MTYPNSGANFNPLLCPAPRPKLWTFGEALDHCKEAMIWIIHTVPDKFDAMTIHHPFFFWDQASWVTSLWKDTLIFNVDPIDRPEVPCDVVSVNSVINTCNEEWRVAVDTWTRRIFSVDCCLLPCSPRYPYRFVKEKLWRKWFCFCGWYRFSGPTQLVTLDMIWSPCATIWLRKHQIHTFFSYATRVGFRHFFVLVIVSNIKYIWLFFGSSLASARALLETI